MPSECSGRMSSRASASESCHPERAQRFEGSALSLLQLRFLTESTEIAEDCFPGRAGRTRSPGISIHNPKCFDGPAERSLLHAPRPPRAEAIGTGLGAPLRALRVKSPAPRSRPRSSFVPSALSVRNLQLYKRRCRSEGAEAKVQKRRCRSEGAEAKVQIPRLASLARDDRARCARWG
jgi:hypothetical protein